jgi:PAS domain S-box-containing protein
MPSSKPNFALNMLMLVFTLITEPSKAIATPEERRHARLAASLFALTLILLITHIIFFSISSGRFITTEAVLALALLIVQYLCRTRWSRVAIPVGLFITFAAAPFLLFIEPNMDGFSLQLLLSYPIIGVLLTYLIYGGLPAVVIAIISTIGMWFSVITSGMAQPATNILTGYVVQSITIAMALIYLQRYEANAVQRSIEDPSQEDQRIRRIIDNVADIVLMTDGSFIIKYVNRAATLSLGYLPDEFEGRSLFTVFEVMHPDDRQRIGDALKQVIAQKTSIRTEYRLRKKSGEYLWLETICNFVYAQNGSIDAVIFTGRDIADRMAAEAAERQQRQFSDALRLSVAEMTEVVDFDQVLNRVLRQGRAMFTADAMNIMMIEDGAMRIVRSSGYEQFGIQPKTSSQEIEIPDYTRLHGDPSDAQGEKRRLRSHLSAPIRVDDEVIGILNLDKIEQDAFDAQTAQHLQAFADQSSIAVRNAQLYLQVTRYAEELELLVDERTDALMNERRQLQTILNAMSEGVAYVEGDFTPTATLTTTYVNPALIEMTGYDASELKHTNLSILMNPVDRAERAQANRRRVLTDIERAGVSKSEQKLFRSDGRAIDAYVTVTRVDDGLGQIAGAVTVIRDISEEKVLREQRERFIAHASHELRTPVTNLMTRLYLARKRPEPFEQHLDILDDISVRMKRLVDDLLDVSKMDRQLLTLKQEPIAVGDLVQKVVQLQQGEAEKKHIRLSFSSDNKATNANLDADRMTQVFTNLISNAINYTQEGGEVVVCQETDEINRHVSISVRDTGIGIPQEHLGQIFTPFFRVPNEASTVKGTGLGLAISKEIVDLHGGTMTVESESGSGSRFIVRLPM